KKPDEQRKLARQILFPLAVEGWQVSGFQVAGDPQKVGIEQLIRAVPDAKLNDFLVEATKRRMVYDILVPMEVFRPSAVDDTSKKEDERKFARLFVDQVGNVVADKEGKLQFQISYEDMLGHLSKRFDQVLADTDWIRPEIKRDNLEKRRAATFLLLTIADLERPDRPPEAKPAEGGK